MAPLDARERFLSRGALGEMATSSSSSNESSTTCGRSMPARLPSPRLRRRNAPLDVIDATLFKAAGRLDSLENSTLRSSPSGTGRYALTVIIQRSSSPHALSVVLDLERLELRRLLILPDAVVSSRLLRGAELDRGRVTAASRWWAGERWRRPAERERRNRGSWSTDAPGEWRR